MFIHWRTSWKKYKVGQLPTLWMAGSFQDSIVLNHNVNKHHRSIMSTHQWLALPACLQLLMLSVVSGAGLPQKKSPFIILRLIISIRNYRRSFLDTSWKTWGWKIWRWITWMMGIFDMSNGRLCWGVVYRWEWGCCWRQGIISISMLWGIRTVSW